MRRLFSDSVTILDVGCGDGAQMAAINFDKKYKVTGVDLYKPYLKKAEKTGLYSTLTYGDVRKLKYKKNSFDIVFSSQVVEHLEKEESLQLIEEMERIAKKKVIIGTTNGFFPFDPLEGKDKNPLQVHKSGWGVLEMSRLGYSVFGQGLGLVYKPWGLAHKIPQLNTLWFGLSYVFSPITYIFPYISAYIIVVKNK